MSLPPVEIKPLSQLTLGQDWRIALAHDRPQHVVIWVTRGQGRLLLNGTRRGVGTHNALTIPPHTLFSLDLGRQGVGMAALIPDGTEVRLPIGPRQLRIRDVDAIGELTGIFEAAHRETTQGKALAQDAIDAQMSLLSVWLRRQIALPENLPVAMNAAARLSARFCERVARDHASGLSMAEHAAELGVTATHLTRACKAATGRTAADLLTERILYAARVALIETAVPVQDIARHLGFGSAAYFTRFMQQHTGQTPTALRKAAR
ncbi:AraC family transcriptional regulator [Tateyamaria omphalii]|uniref:helix-turn-helix domain-containing protein n=1 Tax=Tateyamaria omphalii TaxID=299262 RepID=UPI001C993714|nr:AraC family transcriptional regulator [Tateyamaria omphalii]MBY5932800.1 AraC family transcriptional regulator [Tateyamaria omphalii]